MRSTTGSPGHGGRAGTRARALRVRLAVVGLLAFPAIDAAPAAAQTDFIVAGHVGGSTAVPGGVMVGVGTEMRSGPWGLRVGFGVDAAGTALAPFGPRDRPSGVWSSDLDVGLNLARVPVAESWFGATDPSVFLGAGGAGVSTTDPESGERSRSIVPTWSVGARGGYPLSRWAGVEVEARRREAIGEMDANAHALDDGWEYRVGLALRLGGATSAPIIAPPQLRPDAGPGPVGAILVPISAAAPSSGIDAVAAIASGTVRTAGEFVGTRYRWGGATPGDGFDCSGFVQYVFRQQGIELPRVSRDQARAGRPMPASLDDLQTGDLLFFAQGGPTIDHVAIYAGDGRIVHSSRSGYGVRYDELTGARGRWYAQHLVAVRRVIDAETIAALEPSRAGRVLPMDDQLDALEIERGDAAPPPEPGR